MGAPDARGFDDMGAYDRRWRTVRAGVLSRDGYRCQMRLDDRCTVIADTVDHIDRLMDGGAKLDPANLRAACKHCNSRDGAEAGNARRQPHTPW